MGPSLDLSLRRFREASSDLHKEAHRQHRPAKKKARRPAHADAKCIFACHCQHAWQLSGLGGHDDASMTISDTSCARAAAH